MEALTAQCAAHSIGPANQLLTLLLQTIVSAQCAISPPEKWPADYGLTALEKGLDEYDFIVIGSGSAGSAVASRLSENANWKVLLLEAGGNPPIESEVPFLYNYIQKTSNDWAYFTECEADGCRGTKRGNFWPRGKMLGGSSGINAQVYIRGNRRDYDDWEKAGNPSWSWNNVLEYFKKAEDNRDPRIAADKKNHGTGGPLKVETYTFDGKSERIFIDSAVELGYKEIIDANGDEYLGWVIGQNTFDKGMRCSSAKAYLIPAKNRPNLHVIKHAHVTKIDFNEDKSVAGVQFVYKEKNQITARVRKEVVLSAGAIGSPQILLNSGIGPETHLKNLNIPVVQNAAVGRNLQDHVFVPYFVKFNKPVDVPYSNAENLNDLYKFAVNRSGLFSTIGIVHLMGFVSTINDPDYPDIQYHYFFWRQGDPITGYMLNLFGYRDEIVESIVKENEKAAIGIIVAVLLKPKSIGKLELQSSNPYDSPKIYANYFGEQADVDTVVRSMRLCQKMSATSVFKDNGVEEVRVDVPGCVGIKYDSDKYWQCYVKQLASTLYHPTSTVKMGPSTDREAVVDSVLQVKGVKGVRVADASIMPNIVSGNTNAPSIMIGEKVSDFIKEKWIGDGGSKHIEL